MGRLQAASLVICVAAAIGLGRPCAAEGVPAWVEAITLSGDLRVRHDTQWRSERGLGDERDTEYARNRERFRLRLGLNAKTSAATEVGVRLASGEGLQNTTNQSFDQHARGKGIFIDRAYASWKATTFLKIVAGKHKNPLFTTPLVWDPDVNPEGASETFNVSVDDQVDVFAHFGQWIVEEIKTKTTNGDPALLAYQIGSVLKPTEAARLQIAGTYYDFLNLDVLEYDEGLLSDDADFLGDNEEHGQQMIFDGDARLLNAFRCVEVVAHFNLENLPVPLSVFGSYVTNLDADTDELIDSGMVTPDSVSIPANLERYSGDDRDKGWVLGLSVGSSRKPGDWKVHYFYEELEDYAFPAVFVDSDFHGGGTNSKGHYVQASYALSDQVQARATGFFTKRQDERKDGKKDEDRIQLDVILEF